MAQKQAAGPAQERAAWKADLSLSPQQTRTVQTPGGHTKGDKPPQDPAPRSWVTRAFPHRIFITQLWARTLPSILSGQA